NIIGKVTERPYAEMFEILRRVTNFITETFENIHELLVGEAQKKRQKECEKMYQEVDTISFIDENTENVSIQPTWHFQKIHAIDTEQSVFPFERLLDLVSF
ncbi:MAG: ABC transporter, ATP-binding protein, partial [Pseudothermotoga lettingae]